MRGIRGITLIALVITIIVLVILAGITINLIMNDNSIVEIAGKAKEQTEEAKEKELFKLVEMGYKTKKHIDKTIMEDEYFKELKKQELISDTTVGGKNIKEIEPTKPENNRYEIVTENGYLVEVEISNSGIVEFIWKGKTDRVENSYTVDSFVAFFNQVYDYSTADEMKIAVVDYNANYANVKDNEVAIVEPGDYIAFAFVGRAAFEGWATFGHIIVNGEPVKGEDGNSNFVGSCSNNEWLTGMKSYSFSVGKNNKVSIAYSISSENSYGTATCGSLIIVKRDKSDTKLKDGLVAVLDTNYVTSSTGVRNVPIIEYNNNYTQVEGDVLTINEPGEYTAFASVGRSSKYGFSSHGQLFINGAVVNRADNGREFLVWACSNMGYLTGAYAHRFTVELGNPVSLEYKMWVDGAYSGRNCGSLILVKNK